MNCKKILVTILSIAMLLCFAGCNKAPEATPTNPPAIGVQDPEATGMLLLSMDAEVKVTYDDGGLVMGVEAVNELGSELLEKCNIAEGTACDAAVADLVKLAVENTTSDLKAILIKQTLGSKSPSAKFLEDVRVDAEAAANGLDVILVEVSDLTEDGYLTAETAKDIFQRTQGIEGAQISDEMVNGSYNITVTDGEEEMNYTMDGDTGRVTYLEPEPEIDLPDETANATEEYFDPAMETTAPTEPAYEETVPENAGVEENFESTQPTVVIEETEAATEPATEETEAATEAATVPAA